MKALFLVFFLSPGYLYGTTSNTKKKLSHTILSFFHKKKSLSEEEKLFDSIRQNKIDEAREVLEKNPQWIETKNSKGQTPIYAAVYQGNLEMTLFLIKAGANTKIRDENEKTLLHVAAKHGDTPMSDLLITNGADIKARNKKGNTPLHSAIPSLKESYSKKETVECLLFLIKSGAPIEAKNKFGLTPLHKAVLNNQCEAVNFLVKCGANIHMKNSLGEILNFPEGERKILIKLSSFLYVKLFKAFLHNDVQEMENILEEDPFLIETKDLLGFTLPEEAVYRNRIEAVEFFLRKGIKVDTDNVNNFKIFSKNNFLTEVLVIYGKCPFFTYGHNNSQMNGHIFLRVKNYLDTCEKMKMEQSAPALQVIIKKPIVLK